MPRASKQRLADGEREDAAAPPPLHVLLAQVHAADLHGKDAAALRAEFERKLSLCDAGSGGVTIVLEECGGDDGFEHAMRMCRSPRRCVVVLDGLLVQTLRSSVQEIFRQLGQSISDDVLAAGSINACFAQLKTTMIEAKMPIVFVLKRLEEFVLNMDQSLLYQLLDAAQFTNVYVVGLTHINEVVDQLEKRVRSRLDAAQLSAASGRNDFAAFYEAAAAALRLAADSGGAKKAAKRWNESVEAVWRDERCRAIFASLYDYSRTNAAGRNLLRLILVCNAGAAELTVDCVQRAALLVPHNQREPFLARVTALSNTELCVLVGARRVHNRLSEEPFNFEMVKLECGRYLHKEQGRLYGSGGAALRHAWSALAAHRILVPLSDAGARHAQPTFRMFTLQDEVLEQWDALMQAAHLPASLQHWLDSH